MHKMDGWATRYNRIKIENVRQNLRVYVVSFDTSIANNSTSLWYIEGCRHPWLWHSKKCLQKEYGGRTNRLLGTKGFLWREESSREGKYIYDASNRCTLWLCLLHFYMQLYRLIPTCWMEKFIAMGWFCRSHGFLVDLKQNHRE